MSKNSIITELNATNWAGQFTFNGATGSFNANQNKQLQNITGTKEGYGSFDAYRYGEESWQYNPHFTDPTKAADLIALMTGSIEAVQAELTPAE